MSLVIGFGVFIGAMVLCLSLIHIFEEILLCMTKTFLKGMIKARGLNRELVSLDLEITLNFYSYAITGIMIELCRKKEIDIDAYAKAILRVLEKGLKDNFTF